MPFFLHKETLEIIYIKTAVPCVTYGIAVWGTCSSTLFDDLESVHIIAAKVICNVSKGMIHQDILNYADW